MSEQTDKADDKFGPRDYDEIVDCYGLEVLKQPGDLSVENGDIALTKDRDLRLGSVVYSAMFRFVQVWRLTEPHLRRLFDVSADLMRRSDLLDNKINDIGERKGARFDIRTHLQPDPEFEAAFRHALDEQRVAQQGYSTFAGCAVLVVSSMLLRFKDDLDATAGDWASAGPRYGGHSLGQLIVASANGFRHGDEWAKTYPANSQQRASQNVLSAALIDYPPAFGSGAGRCPDVLHLLGKGGFAELARSVFKFGDELSRRCQSGR